VKLPINATIPGQPPIELIAYYDQLAGYYQHCELATKRWCVEHAKPDWTWFDCGAHIGYYTLLFARLSPTGRVVAFEPTSTFDMLQANLQHHAVQNVVPEQVALGAHNGVRQETIVRLWGHATDTAAFPFMTLDAYVNARAINRLDCIKIDVDSFELDVLQGGQETLVRFDPWIIIELTDLSLTLRGHLTTECLAWFAAHGYTHATVLDSTNYVLRRRPEARAAAGLTLHFS
jgi:FkbM family methyltransferase